MIWLGRRTADPLLRAAEGYEARLQRLARLRVDRLGDAGSATAQARAIAAQLSARAYLIACDEGGESLSTSALAARLGDLRAAGWPCVSFVVGGADGLPPATRKASRTTLSLSPLTLPHRLALVVLLEQLYRVQTLARGAPYHRGAARRPSV